MSASVSGSRSLLVVPPWIVSDLTPGSQRFAREGVLVVAQGQGSILSQDQIRSVVEHRHGARAVGRIGGGGRVRPYPCKAAPSVGGQEATGRAGRVEVAVG